MSAVRRRRSPRARGWRRPELTCRRWETRCHRRALAHAGNARDAGRWRPRRRTDRGAHSFCGRSLQLSGVVARAIRGKRKTSKNQRRAQPEVTSEGTRERAPGAMSDTTPWWERPSTQPAEGGDDGCSISTSVTVRPRDLKTRIGFVRPDLVVPNLASVPGSTHPEPVPSSAPRSTRARPRPTRTA